MAETAGEGVRATVGGREFFIGRPVDPDVYGAQLDLGRTVVEMRSGDEVLGFIAVEDPIREDTPEAVRWFREMGVVLLHPPIIRQIHSYSLVRACNFTSTAFITSLFKFNKW